MKFNKPLLNDLQEKTISKSCLYQGKSFSFWSDEVILPNGKQGKRDYVSYPEAVVILPILDENILFVKQYRYALKCILLELPAGKIIPGESLQETLRRELREETGYDTEETEYLFSYYPCPGYSTERIHIYVATNLKPSPLPPDEDEFILTTTMTFNEAKKAIQSGEIEDGKTILALLAYETKIKREKNVWSTDL